MKHDFKVTLILVFIFLVSQIAGLYIINQNLELNQDPKTGVLNESTHELPAGMERPDVDEDFSWLFIFGAIIIGTIMVLILVRFKQKKLWKLWYLSAVVMCITISFSIFFGGLIAFICGIILGIWKVFRPNFYVHNLTEIFIYGGIAAIFVPIINIPSALGLLLIISIYDMIAVWQSKHMVKLAEFQTDSNVFAGLMIPYKQNDGKILTGHEVFSANTSVKKNHKQTKLNHNAKLEKDLKKLDKIQHVEKQVASNAILGGGDIGFPLIFAGVIMKELQHNMVLKFNETISTIGPEVISQIKTIVFFKTLVIPVIVSFSLLALLYYGKKGKFYPAMPFLSVGCLLGWLVVSLL
jgi:presenilin-like A22 family membrane protease